MAERASEVVGELRAANSAAGAPTMTLESTADGPRASTRTQPVDEAPAPKPKRYVVQPGDFLGRIAEDRGCTVADLMAANHLANDRILVGQSLRIPPACGGAPMEIEQIERGGHYRERGIDSSTLPKLMRARGFDPPDDFKALVVEITFDASRRVIKQERGFDWHGTSDDGEGWNPASSIKLYAAIAALKRIEEAGFSSNATAHYRSDHRHRQRVADLVRDGIIDSSNIAYNRMVQLASFDYLNGTFLTEANGFEAAALMRAYYPSKWKAMGESSSLRVAPDIVLVEGEKRVELPGGRGEISTDCGNAACSTLQDLAEAMRRLMLQEQLPASESFGLALDDLIMLRRAMRAERSRGNNVVDALGAVFDDERVRFYSKPGYSRGWFSDNVYIYDPRADQAWIVTMAGHPGRDALDDAARVVAEVIVSGELRRAQHRPADEGPATQE